jgi:drug/metabolite transporter (DMT)-like permease
MRAALPQFWHRHHRRMTGIAHPDLPPERAGWQTSAMFQAVAAIVFIVLAYTVLMLAAGYLPPSYAAGAVFLVPLIGVVAAWWAFAPGRRRQP